jgi:hypothetical protein
MYKKQSTIVSPDEMEIRMTFHNYKLLKKEEFNLKGSHIYFIKGPNEIGKSSILFALRAAMEIKDETPQKVSVGEIEGVNEFTIPGPDGKMYNIVYEFTDSTTKFIIFDQEGNKISKITEMRNIFKYNHVDATTFMSWSHSAEGRRKQKEFILQLLPPDDYIEYNAIETLENTAFAERTSVTKTMEGAKKLKSEFLFTEEEKGIHKNLDAAVTQLANREKEYDATLTSNTELNALAISISTIHTNIKHGTDSYNDMLLEMEELKAKLKTIETASTGIKLTLEELNKQLEEKTKKSNELEKSQKELNDKKDALKVSVEKGREYVTKAKALFEKETKYLNYEKIETDSLKSEKDLTALIQKYRIQKEQIITSGKFPVDKLSFDADGFLTINKFRFDEHQTCESDTILIVAQLMCKMNISPVQILGDASLLDYEKLDKLYEIAKSNGKIMFVDEIDRSLDKLVIVGYEPMNKIQIKDNEPAKPLF